MANEKAILTLEEEQKLLAPINEYTGAIQVQINELRRDGTDRVIALNNHIAIIRENANYSKSEKAALIAKDKEELVAAKAVEAEHKEEVRKLTEKAVRYLDENYDSYYTRVVASCEEQKKQEEVRYTEELAQLKKEHEKELAGLSNAGEIKDEKYVYRNRLFDAKLKHDSTLQEIRDHQHDAFSHRYHLIDLLRLSHFTFAEKQKQKW